MSENLLIKRLFGLNLLAFGVLLVIASILYNNTYSNGLVSTSPNTDTQSKIASAIFAIGFMAALASISITMPSENQESDNTAFAHLSPSKKSWVLFLIFAGFCVVNAFIAFPLRDFALISWIYGTDAYFQQHVQVLSGKPMRLSTGQYVCDFPAVVTSFTAILGSFFSILMIYVFANRQPRSQAPPNLN